MSLSAVVLGTLLFSGCSSTGGHWECEVGKRSGEEYYGCKVRGTWQQALNNFIRPVSTLIAETLGYTYSDWENSDFSAYSISLVGAGTAIKNSIVTVTVYEDALPLGNKNFNVQLINGKYKFVSPTAVQDWALNFINAADSVEVDFDITNTSEGQALLSAYENNELKAATTFYATLDNGSSGVEWEIE